MELHPELLHFVDTYGYLAVFIGSLVEGEAFVIVASFMAYLGKMHLPLVMLVAFLGTWISDIVWFMIGRYSSNNIFEKWQWLNRLNNQSIQIIGKKPRTMSFFMRFMYGLRIIVPFTLGKTSISNTTFLVYNAFGVFLWVGVFSAIGYFLAGLTETIFGKMRHLEIIVPTVVVITLLCFIYASHIIEYLLKIYPRKQNPN
jgi:membrane protein DedA with SNARE-associated domain